MVTAEDKGHPQLLALRHDSLDSLKLDLTQAQGCFRAASNSNGSSDSVQFPLYILGFSSQTQTWTLAMDITAAKEKFLSECSVSTRSAAELQDLRHLLTAMAPEDCALAGQAAALSQWHQVRSTHAGCRKARSRSCFVQGLACVIMLLALAA